MRQADWSKMTQPMVTASSHLPSMQAPSAPPRMCQKIVVVLGVRPLQAPDPKLQPPGGELIAAIFTSG